MNVKNIWMFCRVLKYILVNKLVVRDGIHSCPVCGNVLNSDTKIQRESNSANLSNGDDYIGLPWGYP
jgi:hypothetical protein